ncbi:hypothetical protein E4U14_000549 [Claviceps sp. LM454 group G7]|nr:hypothetical protein E4U14_000549 [Claviceps sp. LM454 group G7]
MANETTTPPAAATGRFTRSTAQAAASTSPASHVKAEYLTRDMLPDRLSRFAGYITSAWEDRRTTITQHSTTTDIDNKLAYLYNHYVEHGKTHEMLRRTVCEDCEDWTVKTWSRASRRVCQELRDLLVTNDIYVGNGSGSKLAVHLRCVVIRYMRDAGEDLDEEEFDEEDESPDELPIPVDSLYREGYCTGSIDEDLPPADFCEEHDCDDTLPNEPDKQIGKEEEILPEGFSPCERKQSRTNLEFSPRDKLVTSWSREILVTANCLMPWNAALSTMSIINLPGVLVVTGLGGHEKALLCRGCNHYLKRRFDRARLQMGHLPGIAYL